MSCEVTWQIKYLSPLVEDTDQTRQGADLPWHAPTPKATWPLDQKINRWPRDSLKDVCLRFQEMYISIIKT